MSWYKKAKLIDKTHGTKDKPMPVQCVYCKRWATHPVDVLPPREQMIWKKPEELDVEEIKTREVQKVLGEEITSGGICPYCVKIIKERGMKDIEAEEIKTLSLSYT